MVKEPSFTREELAEADRVLARQPRTRAECPPADVPCPFVACRYHLWTVRTRYKGAVIGIRESPTWGDREHACALHEADKGEQSCVEVAAIMRISRQRVHQVEHKATKRMREQLDGKRSDATDAPLSWEASGTMPGTWSQASSTAGWYDTLMSEATRRREAARTVAERTYANAMIALATRCRDMEPFICPVCGTDAPALTMKGRPRSACVDPRCRIGARAPHPTPRLGPSPAGGAIGYRQQKLVFSVAKVGG